MQESISNDNKEKGMVIKVDMENTFDRVNHEFLFVVMQKFGFGTYFISLIKSHVGVPWITPLINGHPAPFFQSQRGIRKGFLMSPLLYILVVDTLSRRLNRLRNEGSLLGISIESEV